MEDNNKFIMFRNFFLSLMFFIVCVAVYQLVKAVPKSLNIIVYFAILAPIVSYIAIKIYKKFSIKCPKCSGVMEYDGYQVLYKSNTNRINKYPSIAIKIYKCKECGNIFHSLYHIKSNISVHRSSGMLYGVNNNNSDTSEGAELLEDKYLAIENEIKRKIESNNLKAGFVKYKK